MQNFVDLKSIEVGDRYRKDYGDLSGIKQSIEQIGLIHPLVLSKIMDNTYILVAGGRRIRALSELGHERVYHHSVLDPKRPGFVFAEEVPEDVRREAELDENLFRLKTKWTEDVLLIADVHKMKKKVEGTKWGVRQTAAVLGPGYSKASVNNAVRLAKLLRAGDEEVMQCKTMMDALAVLTRRRGDEAMAELQRRAAPALTSSFLDSINISLKKPSDLGKVDIPIESLKKPRGDGEPVEIPMSKMFKLGAFQEVLPQIPSASFDHVVTDIPYGIDMDNLNTFSKIDSVLEEHDVDDNVEMMEPFLQQAFRLVRSGGFCVFFYDMDWHEYLQSTAETVGWKVQRWPLIFYKTSTCRNSTAQYNFTKNYECAMVLRRDESTVLRSPQQSSVWMGDFAAERALYNNQFAKPFAAWRWIYDAIALQGQSVLDPFVGECSSARAAANCGLIPFGCEINEKHFNRGMHHMREVYKLIHGDNVRFS
jgi:ParB-like chromosome segregation protein Spo0J/DNA modification methylase